MTEINNYTTQNLHGDLLENGVQKVMLQATIREERLLQIHVEVLDPAYVKANQADVQAAIGAFVLRAANAATENGVPVRFAMAQADTET